jgi:hypothetical protein
MERIERVETFLISRYEDGSIFLYRKGPNNNIDYISIPNNWFKNVTVKNSPQTVEMKIVYELKVI